MKILSKREYTDKNGNQKLEVIVAGRPKIVFDVIIDKEGKKLKRKLLSYTETYLIEPSQWYIDNELKPSQEISKRMRKDMERDEQIARKIREMAIRELEKENNK